MRQWLFQPIKGYGTISHMKPIFLCSIRLLIYQISVYQDLNVIQSRNSNISGVRLKKRGIKKGSLNSPFFRYSSLL